MRMQTSDIRHVGFIMDGNRRWARDRGLPTLIGHQHGYDNLKNIADACFARGISIASFYAFSQENWRRSREEVEYLLTLLTRAIDRDARELHERNIRIHFIGDLDGFPNDLAVGMRNWMQKTRANSSGTVIIAANYTGRWDILQAARTLVRAGTPVEDVNEDQLSSCLATAGFPDPDLIVRTSNERRLSGFLTWQSVYSELYFTHTHWPAFDEAALDMALAEYATRQRRFGA